MTGPNLSNASRERGPSTSDGRGGRRRPPRKLSVIRKSMLSPHMCRITLGGADMEGFPEGRESANFKLHLPRPGQREPVLRTDSFDPSEEEKTIVRTYTLRRYNSIEQSVDVDFFIHENPGPASFWAVNAKPGDKVGFAGPGPDKLADFSKDWFLFAGDMSALPAIGANIERLPTDARGYAVLEIVEEADKQALPFPDALQVRWVINPHPDRENRCLFNAVDALEWLPGQPAVWIAGESNTVRALRRHLSEKHGLGRDGRYCSGYWQMGLTEDQHQLVKRQDTE